MAGITISLDSANVLAQFKALEQKTEDMSPAFREVGEILLNNTRDRLADGVDVDNNAFAPLSSLTKRIKRKNKDKVLIDSGDLYRELTYQLVRGGLEFGSDRKYAAIHQLGGTIKPVKAKKLAFGGVYANQVTIPARPFIGFTQKDSAEVLLALSDHLASAFK